MSRNLSSIGLLSNVISMHLIKSKSFVRSSEYLGQIQTTTHPRFYSDNIMSIAYFPMGYDGICLFLSVVGKYPL